MKKFTKDLIKNGEEIEKGIKNLITSPFSFIEIVLLVDVLLELYKDVASDYSADELYEEIVSLWEYYDDKFKIVDKIDDMIELPAIVEPFDGPAINILIKRIVIGVGVKYFLDKLGE